MAFFNASQYQPDEQYDPMAEAMAESNNPSGGILGMLRNPRTQAALAAMSQGFAAAGAPNRMRNGGGAMYALSQGLSAGASGAQSWEEEQAKAAAERLNARLKGQDTTDYRFQVDALARDYMKKDPNLDPQDAQTKAVQDIAQRGFEQKQNLAGTSYGNQVQLEILKNQLRKGQISEEMFLRLSMEPDIAAAVETAKSKAAKGVEREQEAEGAVVAQDILGSIADDLAILPSPAALKVEGAKAFVGMGDDEVQAALGRIATNNGLLIEYVKKLPGASTDREFPVFMASAGIAVDESKPKEQRIASALAARKYFAGIEARQKSRMQGGNQQKPAATAGKKLRYNPATRKVE